MSNVQVYPSEKSDSKLKDLPEGKSVSSSRTGPRSRLEQLEKTKTKTCCGKNIFRKKFTPSQHHSLHSSLTSDSDIPTTKLQRLERVRCCSVHVRRIGARKSVKLMCVHFEFWQSISLLFISSRVVLTQDSTQDCLIF